MAVLFLSHASRDDALARALEAWLKAKGFDDLFVDHSTIEAGEHWRQALRQAAGACRVVVCLVTTNWLASDVCFGEFEAAWIMGKRIVPLYALGAGADVREKDRLAKVKAEDQGLDLTPCVAPDGALDLSRDPETERRFASGLRAAGALAKVGLDPEAFKIDAKLRPTPFPGLASFADEDADAAVFYGRSVEIAETLEHLRMMRAAGDPKPYVILGASGSGKSSLLKAGVIPRLRREAPAWLPLRAFRPGADPLGNFAEALARTFADYGRVEAYGLLRDVLFDAWAVAGRPAGKAAPVALAALKAALEDVGQRLRAAAGRPGATILVSVDQAEELARAEGEGGDALAAFLRAGAASDPPWRVVLTIRSDSFPELQRHLRFEDWGTRPHDLRAVKAYRFDSLIDEPARRYGVRVETALTEALIDDAPKEDALPLLAYGLQRLWRQYAASGELKLEHYSRVGRLSGLIEDGAERALRGLSPDEDVALPPGPPAKARLDLAAATFVPALAQVNDQRATIRRIAEWASFSDEQRDLLARFDQWRLVLRKGDAGTVEVAHEALFREWKRLAQWLEPERARLEALRTLQVDALTWESNAQAPAFLNHRGARLAEAHGLEGIDAYAKRLFPRDAAYLAACGNAEAAERRRARWTQASLATLAAGLVLGLFLWTNQAFVAEQMHWWRVMRPYRVAHFDGRKLTAERERALRGGEPPFRECDDSCPWMMVVPAGAFDRGSPDSEPGHDKDEEPVRRVTIARPFAVGAFDVTWDEWQACADVGACSAEIEDFGMGRGDKPVVGVTLDDARRYAAWLSRMTGADYRLLSEAEWEYAARGGRQPQTAYPWGDEIDEGNANCKGCGGKGEVGQTSPVKTFKPNGFGLYDMAGNVFQWTGDCYHSSYKDAPDNGSPWTEVKCTNWVVRGGSWNVDAQLARSASRDRSSAGFRVYYLGFRVARTLTP